MVSRTKSGGFRPDIDGLRGLAILLVVGYHVGGLGLPGGFVGVDVFFVISGFLITGKLLDEVRETSTVRLRSFWAGRVRRLVPALAVMVAATLVLSLFVLSPLEWSTVARDGAASVTYVSNLVFARQATDYFAADVTSSLFLHTWSLSVEEQFYLVWPVLMLAVERLLRGRGERRLARYAVVLGVIGAVSFALAVVLTARGTPLSFFGLPTRAWEFAVGGLLACQARRPSPLTMPKPVAIASAAAGVVLIGIAALRFTDATPYPGAATLLPALGTLAVIAAGATGATTATSAATPIAAVFSTAPAQWLGRVSYSWYLWHWPLMLLAAAHAGADTKAARTIGVLAALAVAAAGLQLVENPIRFNPRLVARPAQTFAVGAAFTVVALALAVGVRADAQHQLDDPLFERLTAARASFFDVNADAGCESRRSPSGVAYCEYGDAQAATTVLLTGDSHAAHWIPGFAEAARASGRRLIVHTRGGCPSVAVTIAVSTTRLVPSDNCLQFRADTDRLVTELHPQVVVLANANFVGRILDRGNVLPDGDRQLELWRSGLATTIDGLQAGGRRVGLVLDNPTLPFDPNICIARERSVSACEPTRAQAVGGIATFNEMEQAEARAAGGLATFDITPTICDADRCALERDGQLVYQDASHLTIGFAAAQAPALTAFLERLGPTA